MKKLITSILVSFFLICSNAFSGNIYLIANNGTTWTSTPTGFDNIYKVDLSNSGVNGTTAVTLQQWLADRNATSAPTYLINGNTGVKFTTSDQVWVAAGTYAMAAQWNILSGSGAVVPAAIYGGFGGSEITLNDRSKGIKSWEFTNETILNGSTSANGIINAASDRTIIFDGLSFTACPSTAGQAVFQRPNMTIQNCKFSSNACVALRYYITTASKTAATSNCYFTNNTYTVTSGTDGGCIMANNGSSGGTYTITDCVFDSNSSTANGSGASAGIKAQGTGTVEVNKCIFKNNNATAGNSSAVSITSATCAIKNSLIYGTSNVNNKVAVYVSAGSVINCTVVNNLGGGAYLSNTSSSTINLVNNVFWGEDTKSGQISTLENCLGNITNCAYTSLSTNFIGSNSNKVDLTTTSTGIFTDPANNLWTLATGSSLIDTGTSTGAPIADLVGTNRPQGGGFDIGAYERTTTTTLNNVKQLKWIIRNGNLIINEIDNNESISIYNIAGKKLVETTAKNNVVSVSLSKGIYIVKANNTKTKVFIN